MPLRQPDPAPDDPRLTGHQTTYQGSRGGHFPPRQTPAPDPTKRR